MSDCSYCGSKNLQVYNSRVLVSQFRNLCELYTASASTDLSIEEQIEQDFPHQIFTFSDPIKIRKILIDILSDEYSDFKGLFDNPVQLSCRVDSASIEQADNLRISWDKFVQEIKTENRYHITNKFDLVKLEKLLRRYGGKYSKGRVFYRARISPKDGYSKESMGNPPNNEASQGRANPEGISYLYLSDDMHTTLYETRAYLFDYVTIGEFKLKQAITTVNLRQVEDYDPMLLADNDDLEDFIIHLPFVSHLARNLSKPIRKNDNELDYYPTQYLSEFIKSLGYDGIEYGSSLNPKGYNLAVFNLGAFDCCSTSIKEINEITFKHRAV